MSSLSGWITFIFSSELWKNWKEKTSPLTTDVWDLPFKDAHQRCPSKMPFNDALQRCPSRMPFNDALQICPSKTPFKDALQWCPSKMPFPCSTDSNDLAIKEVKNHNFISKDCQTSRKSSPGSRWPGDEGGVASDHLYSLGQGSPETEVLRIDEILYPAH